MSSSLLHKVFGQSSPFFWGGFMDSHKNQLRFCPKKKIILIFYSTLQSSFLTIPILARCHLRLWNYYKIKINYHIPNKLICDYIFIYACIRKFLSCLEHVMFRHAPKHLAHPPSPPANESSAPRTVGATLVTKKKIITKTSSL